MGLNLLCFTLLSCIECFVRCAATSIDLLVLVPWPDSRPHAGWDVGLSLLPAGRVAVKAINSNPNVLRDYDINIIEAGHEACGLTENSLGLANLVGNAVRTGANVAAVLGLFCSTSTAVLSPIAGHEGADLIQLSGSYSPVFNKYMDRFPHLWKVVQSATVHADAMVYLMEENDWSRIAIVSNQESTFYSEIAASLIEKVRKENKTIIYHGEVIKLIPDIQTQVLSDLVSTQARIVFLSAESVQIASLLCEAYKRQMKYPSYLWVIADWTLKDLIDAGGCNETELELVLEGSIYSYFHYNISNEIAFYDEKVEFVHEYNRELENVKKDYQELIQRLEVNVTENLYASLLFDQVLAFTLALNSSLPELMVKNISVTDYGFGHPNVTRIIEENLRNLSFQGANGHVQFNDNREVTRPIDLFQIINGTAVLVGDKIYISNYTGKIGFKFSSSLDDKIPEFYQTVNPVVTGIMIVLTVVLVILVTVVLLLILKYRNIQEIKANSVKISMLMFFACYLFILVHVVIIIQTSVQLSYKAYSVLCNMQHFLVINASILLFATLYLKLERIHRIFYNKSLQMYSWSYSNWMIALKVFGICSLGNIIFAVLLIKPIKQGFYVDLKPHESISANFKYPYCHAERQSSYLLYTFYLYLAIFMFLNVYLASRARKISKRGFKNTKLINIYMMFVFVALLLSLPFNELFFVNNMYVQYMNVVIFSCTFLIATLSQLMLFLPSIIHAIKSDIHVY